MEPASHKIAIIGAGSVGAAVANALLGRNIAGEIHLVDINEALCRAQVQDLSDAAFFSGSVVKHSQYPVVGQCDIIVITACVQQRTGDTRLDIVDRNLACLRNILHALLPIRQDSILLMVTNPVDVLTYFAQQIIDLPREQVIGTGTFLDSVRLRHELAERLQVS
jgi:L-lactate dehydrogenase